jgi:uncharacterized protein (DUF1810 family)
MDDPYNLERFVDAQDAIYDQVRSELKEGHKRSHWMWFVFPQIEGLGHSSLARKFAVSSIEEARAYLQHPILGARLIECTELVIHTAGRRVEQIFGYPDDLKFRSSMTLFAHAATDNQIFADAIRKCFGGEYDRLTLERLNVS